MGGALLGSLAGCPGTEPDGDGRRTRETPTQTASVPTTPTSPKTPITSLSPTPTPRSTSISTPTPIDLTETRGLTAAAGDEADSFGESVALARDGTTALIGAPGIDYYERLEAAGAAYVFGL